MKDLLQRQENEPLSMNICVAQTFLKYFKDIGRCGMSAIETTLHPSYNL